jgi:hypothetical protein
MAHICIRHRVFDSSFLLIGVRMKTLVSALMISASVFAGAAHAADEPAVTHAQVSAEFQQARAAGLISTGEQAYPVTVAEASHTSRAAVQAELSAAIAAGQVVVGEEAYPTVAATNDTKSRDQVKAELAEYVASHGGTQIEA